MTAPKRPLDALLDVVLYAPVGFATSSRELLPDLVAKGRQQVDAQVRLARMLGKFAVAYGRAEAQKRISAALSSGEADSPRPAPAARTPAARTAETRPPAARTAETRPAAVPVPPAATAAAPPRGRRDAEEVVPVRRVAAAPGEGGRREEAAGEAPAADELAIPGYDSLAASQVVARLDGLTTVELEQVRRYEQAHRNRKTVLGKIAQLEGTRH